MKATVLNKTNFLPQIVRHGFFAEQFPNCFSTSKLTENIADLSALVGTGKGQCDKGKKNSTSPTTLSMFKNDISRRVLSVPNPEAFLRLAVFINDNWDKIKEFAYSSNSLSPIWFVHKYDGGKEHLINCAPLREARRVRSDYLKGVKECIRGSLGYKYRLQVDITNCYNSMYTHSISWAICGKEKAKTYMRTNTPESLKADYTLADCLDCFTRFQKNNETNGIIVGPFTSRIVSEIILARIDKMLSEKGFVFKRYVDDYKFYFRSESEAQESLPIIEKILNEFNLTLNTSKTSIQKYPYEFISDMKGKYEQALEKDGAFGVLNTASLLHLAGEKGAFKYALKYLRGKPLPEQNDLVLVIPTLVNIMLLDPKYGKYVTDYLKENHGVFRKDALTQVFNIELAKSLESELQQEALLFIQLIRDLGLSIDGKNLLEVLKSDNDFAIIIALDLWKNQKKRVTRTRSEAHLINIAIDGLLDSLKGETLKGARWLLLYEISVNHLVDEKKIPDLEMNSFFQKMSSLNVSFYQSVREEKH